MPLRNRPAAAGEGPGAGPWAGAGLDPMRDRDRVPASAAVARARAAKDAQLTLSVAEHHRRLLAEQRARETLERAARLHQQHRLGQAQQREQEQRWWLWQQQRNLASVALPAAYSRMLAGSSVANPSHACVDGFSHGLARPHTHHAARFSRLDSAPTEDPFPLPFSKFGELGTHGDGAAQAAVVRPSQDHDAYLTERPFTAPASANVEAAAAPSQTAGAT